MPRTFRGRFGRSVLLCFFLAAAFGLLAATPNAGQTGPLATAAAGSQATPITVHGATVNLAGNHISLPLESHGLNLITRGKGTGQGGGTPWRVQHAGRTLQTRSPRYPWQCYICHLLSSLASL